jgi:hypothetical protein
VASDAVSRTPVAVTGATCVALVLLVAGLHGDGHISDRAAWGAILGLIVAQLALAAAALVVHRHGGPSDA